jgi:hypothetical protein
VQRGCEVESLPDDGNEDVDGDRDPDLRLDGVLRGTEEPLDSQKFKSTPRFFERNYPRLLKLQ